MGKRHAHTRACGERRDAEPPFTAKPIAGVFYAFKPQRVELLIWKSQAVPEYLEDLAKRNITPIIIPDGDVDHDPHTPLKLKDEELSLIHIDSLRRTFTRRV